MSYKIAISKNGIDVGTAILPNDFNYSSDYNTLKYYTGGTITLAGTAIGAFTTTTTQGIISHDLGYIPFFTVYMNPPELSSGPYYPNGYANLGAGANDYASAFCGTANLVVFIRLENGAGGGTQTGTATFIYKIYRNNLGL